MSEVQSRPSAPRGRGSARGGRGGYSSRGGRGGSRSAKLDTTDNASTPTSYDDEGDIGQLKKKYSSELPALRELFADWTEDDLVFALEDSNGDLESAIERITEGNVSQWGEVKKKTTTDRSRSKVKETQSQQAETVPASTRGGRGRGGFEGRGRGRGDRGRGGRGGRAGAHTNGTRAEKPATAIASDDAGAKTGAADTTVAGDADAAKEPSKDVPKPPGMPEGTKTGWASLFAKPTPPPPQKKPPPPAAAPAVEKQVEPVPEQKPAEPEPVPAPAEKAPEEQVTPAEAPAEPTPEEIASAKDDLTKQNLEQVPDVSVPPATVTAASTIASVQDPNSLPSTATPTRSNTATSGYAATAYKATSISARGPGYQRRVMEQQEAVVMPANHAVDRAAVQFGSMGLNGGADDVDVDEEREEAETRAQPPQHSPVAPRASLPPSTQAQPPAEVPVIPRPAPGLPPAPQTTDTSFTDFARYGDSQKPYDPFTQQVTQPQPQIQEPFSNQAPAQPTATTGSEYSPFYAADQQRLPYNYYGTYGQSQDASARATGFGVTGAEVQPQIPTSQPPARYGHVEAPNSGHNTPNPALPAATVTQPSAQHIPGAQAAHGGYGYGYPYYSNPHYASYMNQMGQQQYGRNRPMYDDARRYDDHYMPHSSQYGYGSQYGPYGKGGMYGQPQHAFSYDHSSSPANVGAFNQGLPGRESMYGRAGSAQPSETQQSAGSNAFASGMTDVFGRTQSGFGQNQPIAQQQPVTSEEASKTFEASKAGGPSPSLAQANRPGSATNSVPGQPQAQAGLPPLQAQQGQQGFGGYPHLNPQYGGLGGLGNHQAAATQSHHQGTGYGNYGGAGFGSNYYGNTGRGGWGGNYGH
ncbi:conserved hypothetical protein [Paecilomyces variotii No. 5]|uniref:RNA polymerase II degradation factor 1 n=1 Tax=Byssochlamys spectabilis (strain No. 5 / NBRC 109023) TaxID=1356009 RepID=V5HZR9_BYSSN|nr:conserved hypothetical protein [Paecilomyces variotii No. 5]